MKILMKQTRRITEYDFEIQVYDEPLPAHQYASEQEPKKIRPEMNDFNRGSGVVGAKNTLE